ncbi:hypothetical protein ACFQY0_20730, partial [Haloferula chungangensis]
GFFAESVSESLETRRAALETHQENYGESRKAASGIPLWPSRDPIGERGGMNLYGFVWNDGVNWFDYLGMIEVGGDELPDPTKIEPLWVSTLPFKRGGETTYVARIGFTCNDRIIKARLNVFKIEIVLNWNWDSDLSDIKGETDWEGIYGHEQLHVLSVNEALEAIIEEIEQLDEEGDNERAKKLNEEYAKKVAEAIHEALQHDPEPGDPNSTKPREGVPYPPQDGSKPVPPRPEKDPNPVTPQ